MKSKCYQCLVPSFFLFSLLLLGLPSFLGATPLTINPSLTQTGMGLTIIQAGVGLEGLGVGTETIEITIDGPVVSATLYWAGRDIPSCPLDSGACFIPFEPYLDQELLFDGNPITGTIIGQEGQAPLKITTTSDIGQMSLLSFKG